MQYQLGDTLISVGTYIRSYDFPNYIDTYMEGVVIKSELGLLVVRTFNTVVDGVRRQTSSNQETFTTADVGESWYDEVYPDWKRLEVLDNEFWKDQFVAWMMYRTNFVFPLSDA